MNRAAVVLLLLAAVAACGSSATEPAAARPHAPAAPRLDSPPADTTNRGGGTIGSGTGDGGHPRVRPPFR